MRRGDTGLGKLVGLAVALAGCVGQAEDAPPGGWLDRAVQSAPVPDGPKVVAPGPAGSHGENVASQGAGMAPAQRRRALVTWAEGQEPQGLTEGQVEQRLGLPAGAVVRQLVGVGGLVADVNEGQWQRVQSDPAVAAVTADYAVFTQVLPAELVAAMVPGLTGPMQLKVTGAGVTVAVVDTGVDDTHPALLGKVAKHLCFASGGCGAGLDANGHGTHVASLIAGAGKGAALGVAPGAEVLSLRVFGKSGQGKASDILAALDWLVTQGPLAKVRVVNLSLGSNAVFEGTCDSADPLTAKAIAKLRAKGLTVVAASGNSASSKGISAPACLRGVIAVGAVYTADYGNLGFGKLCSDVAAKTAQMTCFSNRSARLDLTAPGALVIGAQPGGGTAVMAGTSQASPVVAAVAALVLQCAPKLTPAKLANLLRGAAKLVPATASAPSHRLVQALPALAKVCPKGVL